MELLDEWAHTQQLYEAIGTIIFVCTAIVIVSVAVMNVVFANKGFFYSSTFDDDDVWNFLGEDYGSDYAKIYFLTVLAFAIYIPYFLVPYLLFLISIDRANRVGDNLRDTIIDMLLDADNDSNAAFKMIKLNEAHECGITLLGRRINTLDIVASIVSAVGFQLFVAVYGGGGG